MNFVVVKATVILLICSLSVIEPQPVNGRKKGNNAEKVISPLASQDLVTSLPGQPAVNFQHYAGYVNVNDTNGRALFYWFYEAATNPGLKPLVLWLNGGKYIPELAEVILGRNSDLSLHIDLKGILIPRMMGGYDLCLDGHSNKFFNRADVQKALHVSDGLQLKNWTICNSQVFYNWSDSRPSLLPIYKKLIAAGLKIWLYSGDTDGRVPVMSTRYCSSALGLPITKTWRPWYHKKQVSGWYQEYEGLTYATFREAGHAVPSKPAESLVRFTSFLLGQYPPLTR